jgi:methyltransferase
MTAAIALLSLVTAERLAELWFARRNTNSLLDQGAYEVAPGHYSLLVLLHASWLAGLWLLGWSHAVKLSCLLIFLALQLLRGWTLLTLGRRWTTRIIVLPGAPLVRTGPYRFVSHPNYLVVIGEIVVLPLCLGLNWYALVFTLANAIVLAIRIRAENAALLGLRDAQRL